MRISRCGLALVTGLSVTVLAACGKAGGSKGVGKSETAKRAVRVARAEVRPMARAVNAIGTLRAQEKSTLSAKVAGRLERLSVDLGSVVRQGDVIAQIEPRDYELGLQQAAAALAQGRTALGLPPEGEDDHIELEGVTAVKLAKAVFDEAGKNLERVKRLSQSGIASQSELDTVEAAYTVALSRYEAAREEARGRMAAVAQRRAELELARKQLTDASVRAPFDGAVQARQGNIGEYLAAGAPIVDLVKTDPLRLRLEVPERDSLLVQAGQGVELVVEGDTNAYSGRIARLSPALDEQTRMLLVEADVPRQGPLRPGLFARARIIVREAEDGLSVPAESLIIFAGLEKVVVVQDGKALEKVVTTGRRGREWVEIISGLAAGETLVLSPGGLRTGQAVSVENGGSKPRSAQATRQEAEYLLRTEN